MNSYLRDMSESESYEGRANELVRTLRGEQMGKLVGVIAIGGVSGTGKTSFAQRLGAKIDSSLVLHIDNYLSLKNTEVYNSDEFIDLQMNSLTPRVEGLDVNAWDLPRFVDDVQLFAQGGLKETPVYDPVFQETITEQRVEKGETLIIEGAHVLNIAPLEDQIKSRILLEATFHDRFMRKIVRSSRFNMRSSLDVPITRYVNGSELAWQYYKDEYEKRADHIIENPANPIVDYAQLSALQIEITPEYHLAPYQGFGDMRVGEKLGVRKKQKVIGEYVLNYVVNDRLIVSSAITASTLELLLGYYDMERVSHG